MGKRISTARTIFALAVGASVFFAMNRYFAHFPLTGVGSVLIALLSVITLRSMVRSGQIRNPGGAGEREFGFRPVIDDVVRAAGCIIGGFALVAVGGLAVRYRLLPDSLLTALFTVFPGLIVALIGVWFLARGGYKAVCGVARR